MNINHPLYSLVNSYFCVCFVMFFFKLSDCFPAAWSLSSLMLQVLEQRHVNGMRLLIFNSTYIQFWLCVFPISIVGCLRHRTVLNDSSINSFLTNSVWRCYWYVSLLLQCSWNSDAYNEWLIHNGLDRVFANTNRKLHKVYYYDPILL